MKKEGFTMKVLMINGSARAGGNTAIALAEMEQVFVKNGIEVETVQVGQLPIRGCVECGSCFKTGKCAIDDIVNKISQGIQHAAMPMISPFL